MVHLRGLKGLILENLVFGQVKMIHDADRANMLIADRGIVGAKKNIVLALGLLDHQPGRDPAQHRADHALERIIGLPGFCLNALIDELVIAVEFGLV